MATPKLFLASGIISVKTLLKDTFWCLWSDSQRYSSVWIILDRSLSCLPWPVLSLKRIVCCCLCLRPALFFTVAGTDCGWWIWPLGRWLSGWTAVFCCLVWNERLLFRSMWSHSGIHLGGGLRENIMKRFDDVLQMLFASVVLKSPQRNSAVCEWKTFFDGGLVILRESSLQGEALLYLSFVFWMRSFQLENLWGQSSVSVFDENACSHILHFSFWETVCPLALVLLVTNHLMRQILQHASEMAVFLFIARTFLDD